jgi:hypothetical protein
MKVKIGILVGLIAKVDIQFNTVISDIINLAVSYSVFIEFFGLIFC